MDSGQLSGSKVREQRMVHESCRCQSGMGTFVNLKKKRQTPLCLGSTMNEKKGKVITGFN
jgi:hypothetical protein